MNYFIKLNSRGFGPLSKEQVDQMLDSGKVTAQTPISTDRKKWLPLGSHPDYQCSPKPMDQQAWYFIEQGGIPQGPKSIQEINGLIHSGVINSDMLVWQQGEIASPIGTRPEFASAFPLQQSILLPRISRSRSRKKIIVASAVTLLVIIFSLCALLFSRTTATVATNPVSDSDSQMDDSQMDDSQMDDSQMDDSQMDDSQMDDSQMDDSQMDDSQMDDSQMDDSQKSDKNSNGRKKRVSSQKNTERMKPAKKTQKESEVDEKDQDEGVGKKPEKSSKSKKSRAVSDSKKKKDIEEDELDIEQEESRDSSSEHNLSSDSEPSAITNQTTNKKAEGEVVYISVSNDNNTGSDVNAESRTGYIIYSNDKKSLILTYRKFISIDDEIQFDCNVETHKDNTGEKLTGRLAANHKTIDLAMIIVDKELGTPWKIERVAKEFNSLTDDFPINDIFDKKKWIFTEDISKILEEVKGAENTP